MGLEQPQDGIATQAATISAGDADMGFTGLAGIGFLAVRDSPRR